MSMCIRDLTVLPPPSLPPSLSLSSDSIDTVAAMKVMKELVGSCNVYLGEGVANARLLELVGLYLTDMMKMFGVVPDSTRFGFPVDQQTTDEVHVCYLFN